MPHSAIDESTRTRARRLRRGQTDAERALWRLLRPMRETGVPFRRQTPVGRYVVDFAWLGGRLIIEVDGGQHSAAADATRTAWLQSEGFEILRFWNNDVLANPEGCGTVIAEALARRGRTL